MTQEISYADICRVDVEGDEYDSRIQGGILADGDPMSNLI